MTVLTQDSGLPAIQCHSMAQMSNGTTLIHASLQLRRKVVSFARYMHLNGIDPYFFYKVTDVRLVTVYNAMNGVPIQPENAQKITDAVLKMTGVPYDGTFVLTEQPALIHVKQLRKYL
jgi:hypothetical protein